MKNLFILSGIVLFSMLTSCGDTETKEDNNTEVKATKSSETEPVNTKTSEVVPVETETAKVENNIPVSNLSGVKVKMKTSMGDVTLMLYDETPGHRDNFVKLVNEKFYDGLLFHRVMKDFMIQGGDPQSRGAAPGVQLGMGGPGYTIPAEIKTHLIHKKGALSAARIGGPQNPHKESSGSQFYIVTGNVVSKAQLDQMSAQKMAGVEQQAIGAFLQDPANKSYMDKVDTWNKEYQADPSPQNQAIIQKKYDAMIAEIQPLISDNLPQIGYSAEQIEIYSTIGGRPDLDKEYTVYGEVLEGIEVVEQIQLVPTTSDRPNEDVTILSMEILD